MLYKYVFYTIADKYDKKYSEVESALKVSTVIDWMKVKHKWRRLHLEMPVIVNKSFRHRVTFPLRKCLTHSKMNSTAYV